MSAIGRLAARVAVRLHPVVWRERYETEVQCLIDDMNSSLRDAVDLLRSAAREQTAGGLPMRLEPAYRHPRAFALGAFVLLAPTLVVVALSILGHELGLSPVAAVIDRWLVWVNQVRVVDLALVTMPLVAFALAVVPLLDVRVDRDDGAPAMAIRIRAVPANLLVGALALLVGAALVAHIVVESALQTGA
ncbi:MAG TPA: hypothetical protein VFN76_10590 [Candidatus Limnocylindria bacterium]|nr:hypothetical protein [Candidatus Limnocylindria bacterium]